MKKMNILFIDDEKIKVFSLMNTLIDMKHEVDYKDTPEKGKKFATHQYDLIFIDFNFGISNQNGADLGLELRKKCPLVPLVLLTAYGKENIRDFIYVGFDDYFDNHILGERGAEKRKRLLNCINVALRNSQKRIRTIFSESELETVKNRLNNIETAYKRINDRLKGRNTKITTQMIAIEVSEIEDVRDKKGNRTNLTANNFSVFFGVNNKGGLNINALKARQLLIENPGNWIETKSKFKPLLLLIDELIDKHIKDYQLS